MGLASWSMKFRGSQPIPAESHPDAFTQVTIFPQTARIVGSIWPYDAGLATSVSPMFRPSITDSSGRQPIPWPVRSSSRLPATKRKLHLYYRPPNNFCCSAEERRGGVDILLSQTRTARLGPSTFWIFEPPLSVAVAFSDSGSMAGWGLIPSAARTVRIPRLFRLQDRRSPRAWTSSQGG